MTMNIQFNLQNGMSITASIPNFNSKDFAAQLNDQRTLFVPIGNNGFQKQMLTGWYEVQETEPTEG